MAVTYDNIHGYYKVNGGGQYHSLAEAQAADGSTPTSASMTALLSPADQVAQGNTAADRQLAAIAEANRLATSTADREQRAKDAATAAGLAGTSETNRAADAARAAGLASTTEANRVAMAEADRLAQVQQAAADRASKEGLSAADIAARLNELKTGAALTDTSAANAAARASASRNELIGKIPGLMQTLTGDSGGGGGAAPGGSPAGTDPAAANAATFARAKDQTGQIGRASMASLRDGLAERGGLGGGMEAGGMASLTGDAAGRLGDVTRQQTISGVDTNNQIANRNYAGELTKRGQNLGVSQSILSLLGSRAY